MNFWKLGNKTLSQCDGNADADDRSNCSSSPCTSYRRAKNLSEGHCLALQGFAEWSKAPNSDLQGQIFLSAPNNYDRSILFLAYLLISSILFKELPLMNHIPILFPFALVYWAPVWCSPWRLRHKARKNNPCHIGKLTSNVTSYVTSTPNVLTIRVMWPPIYNQCIDVLLFVFYRIR